MKTPVHILRLFVLFAFLFSTVAPQFAHGARSPDPHKSQLKTYTKTLKSFPHARNIADAMENRLKFSGPYQTKDRYAIFAAYQGKRSRVVFLFEYAPLTNGQSAKKEVKASLEESLKAAMGALREEPGTFILQGDGIGPKPLLTISELLAARLMEKLGTPVSLQQVRLCEKPLSGEFAAIPGVTEGEIRAIFDQFTDLKLINLRLEDGSFKFELDANPIEATALPVTAGIKPVGFLPSWFDLFDEVAVNQRFFELVDIETKVFAAVFAAVDRVKVSDMAGCTKMKGKDFVDIFRSCAHALSKENNRTMAVNLMLEKLKKVIPNLSKDSQENIEEDIINIWDGTFKLNYINYRTSGFAGIVFAEAHGSEFRSVMQDGKIVKEALSDQNSNIDYLKMLANGMVEGLKSGGIKKAMDAHKMNDLGIDPELYRQYLVSLEGEGYSLDEWWPFIRSFNNPIFWAVLRRENGVPANRDERISGVAQRSFIGNIDDLRDWLQITQKLYSYLTEHNQGEVQDLIEKKIKFRKRLNQYSAADGKRCFQLYVDAVECFPRMALQIIEGLINFEELSTREDPSWSIFNERDTILEFIRETHGFNHQLYQFYKNEGLAEYGRLIEFGASMLRDEVNGFDIDNFKTSLPEKYNKDSILLAIIGKIIPTSGSSFVDEDHVNKLFKEYFEHGDKREDIPLMLRSLNSFGGRDVVSSVFRLKKGAEINQAINHLLDQLSVNSDKSEDALFSNDVKIMMETLKGPHPEINELRRIILRAVRHEAKDFVEKIKSADRYPSLKLLYELFNDRDKLRKKIRNRVIREFGVSDSVKYNGKDLDPEKLKGKIDKVDG